MHFGVHIDVFMQILYVQLQIHIHKLALFMF